MKQGCRGNWFCFSMNSREYVSYLLTHRNGWFIKFLTKFNCYQKISDKHPVFTLTRKKATHETVFLLKKHLQDLNLIETLKNSSDETIHLYAHRIAFTHNFFFSSNFASGQANGIQNVAKWTRYKHINWSVCECPIHVHELYRSYVRLLLAATATFIIPYSHANGREERNTIYKHTYRIHSIVYM